MPLAAMFDAVAPQPDVDAEQNPCHVRGRLSVETSRIRANPNPLLSLSQSNLILESLLACRGQIACFSIPFRLALEPRPRKVASADGRPALMPARNALKGVAGADEHVF